MTPIFVVLLLIARAALADLGVYITRSPESTVAPKGDEVVFECSLNLASEKLIWRHRKTNANEYYVINATSQSFDETGYSVTTKGTSSKLRVLVRNSDNAGLYQCVAWFGASALASVPAKLTIASLGDFNPFLKHLETYRASPGNTVALMCPPPEASPKALIQFFKNGEPVSPSFQLLSSGTLVLPDVSEDDSGRYSCSAVNDITGEFTRTSITFDLKVAASPRHPPRFFKEPPSSYGAKIGDNITLECPGVGNPIPTPSWNKQSSQLNKERFVTSAVGLQITNVQIEDQGTYICQLDNKVGSILQHVVNLTVYQAPNIVNYSTSYLVTEGSSIELECQVTGSPKPEMYWLINADAVTGDASVKTADGKMTIDPVEKRHAGIVQCFARNYVGEDYEAGLLQVNPKQISSQAGTSGDLGGLTIPPMSNVSRGHNKKEHRRKNGRRKDKKHRGNVMVPPSQPNVTRLSDESVMVRWHVPENKGLPIQFFKVQYKDLTESSHSSKGSRKGWTTTNDDISPHIRSYEVTNLEPDHVYRFQITAVYSNNDNKQGPNSERFHLQRGAFLGRSPLPAPTLSRTEALGPTSIQLHWMFNTNPSTPVDGFYAYFRPASTAGEYIKATVDGERARSLRIDHLVPNTPYELKVQSFTSNAASEFSAILTQKTMNLATEAPPAPAVVKSSESSTDTSSLVPTIGGALGCALLLVVTGLLWVVCKRRKNKQSSDQSEDNKFPEPDTVHHISAEPNGYPLGAPNGYAKPLKATRIMNGGTRVNITSNPMADEQDDNNASLTAALTDIEMSLLSQNNNCSGASSSTQGDCEGEGTTPTDPCASIAKTSGKNKHKNTPVPEHSNKSVENYV